MHDDVLVALISAIGSILVAYITTHQQAKPSKSDQLREENKILKTLLREERKKNGHHH
jgi:Na+-translocating ferredoxin:NAD+ oxidoreductase RnfG subunit